MTKAIETVKFLAILALIWFVLNSGVLPFPSKIQNDIIPVLPWFLLVSAGAYSLFALGWGIFTLNDKPEKYKELMEQVKEAKADLKNKNIY